MVDEDFLRLLLLSSVGRLFYPHPSFATQNPPSPKEKAKIEAQGATILPYRASDDARAASSYDTLRVTMSGFAAFEDKRRQQATALRRKRFPTAKKQPKVFLFELF